MCGQWWARGCGLPSISSDSCVKSSLKKIFEFNVKKFQCGQIGPINGMRPDGNIDKSCMQSVEVICLFMYIYIYVFFCRLNIYRRYV